VKRVITIREFARELLARIDEAKTIDCCREELKSLARLAMEKMPDETIEVDWVENGKS
jgi:hypothetical protein